MRWGFYLLLVLATFLTSGCWDMREVSNLAIVAGAAFEEAKDPPGDIRVTYQIVIPSKIGSGTEGGGTKGEEPPVRIGTSTGPTVFAAIRAFVTSASRRLFWGHNQLMIIDQSLAKKGITPYMDFYIRDPEPRPDVPILVSRTSAGDILRAHDGVEPISAFGIRDALQAAADNGFCPQVVIQDFMEAMHSKSQAAVAPMIGTYTEVGFEGKKLERSRLGGTAVFNRGCMVGELDIPQTHGLLWVLGKRPTGIIPLTYHGQPVAIEIINSSGHVKPKLDNGSIKVIVEVKLEGNLGEIQGSEEITPQLIASLEKQQNEVVRQEIWSVIRASQKMNADILGVGNSIYHHDPQTWHQIEKQWSEYYPNLPFEVKVTSHLAEIGYTYKGLK